MSIVSVVCKVGAVASVAAGGYWVYKKLKSASVELSSEDTLRQNNEELNKSWKILDSCTKAAGGDSGSVAWYSEYVILRDRMVGPRNSLAEVIKLLDDINQLLRRVVGE
jgi:hypothetical protein